MELPRGRARVLVCEHLPRRLQLLVPVLEPGVAALGIPLAMIIIIIIIIIIIMIIMIIIIIIISLPVLIIILILIKLIIMIIIIITMWVRGGARRLCAALCCAARSA